MDGGCYAIDCLRLLGASDGPGDEPSASAERWRTRWPPTRAARSPTARWPSGWRFPAGRRAGSSPPFTRDGEFRADLHVICEDGLAHLDNFIFPHRGRLLATRDGAVVADEPGGGETTYVYQLRAFAAAIAAGDPVPTSAENAAVTMRLIDDAYRAAGLAARPADGPG